jgi:NACHT domain
LYGIDLPLCQEGTRTSILAGIRSWVEDNSTPERIFWLKDAAGTGKTTVAATLAREFIITKTLAGRFFFTPNSISGTDIGQFCATVAKDMAKHVVSLQDTVTAALNDPLTLQQGFHQQFQRLIVEPLKTLNENRTLVIVIDALDNCRPDGRELLLESILESISDLAHVKVLLTSRPSPDIVGILSGSTLVRESDVQLFDIHDTKLTDINIYVEKTLPTLTVEQRKQVVDYSGGLFIVASTICSVLRWNRQAPELLSRPIYAGKKENMDHLYLNLDALYLQILKHAVFDEIGELAHDMMMSVLQIIIVTFQPVSINTIRKFLPKNVEVAGFVEALGAVLKDGTPDRPIKIIHPTFREFLAETDRANGFLVNTLSSHAATAVGCLDELDRSLDYDLLHLRRSQDVAICNSDVEELQRKVAKATTAATRYASSYWAYHVAASLDNPDVWSKAVNFLGTRFLNWVELMSWRDSLSACVQGLSHLRTKSLPILREREGSFVSHCDRLYCYSAILIISRKGWRL